MREAESHLKEVVLEIAFPLRALFKPLKYLLSLLGTYIKAGKFLLQAYYSFTSGLPPLLVSHKAWISYAGHSSHLGLLSREVLREGLGAPSCPQSHLFCAHPLSGLTLVGALTCLGNCMKAIGLPVQRKVEDQLHGEGSRERCSGGEKFCKTCGCKSLMNKYPNLLQ